jgi:hypothetical protein
MSLAGTLWQMVPELTPFARIQLNKHVLLRHREGRILIPHRTLAHVRSSQQSRRAIILRPTTMSQSWNFSMSDLGSIKNIDGSAAKFIRFAGADMLVIEVNGNETTVTKLFWYGIADFEQNKMGSNMSEKDEDPPHVSAPVRQLRRPGHRS